MFVSGSESLGNSVPVYCSGSTSFDVRSWKISLKNFQGLLSIVQLSMFFFVVAVSCDSFYIISKRFMFVNNFFKLFFVAFYFYQRQLLYNIMCILFCQHIFWGFYFYFQRLKWKVYFHFEGGKVDFSLTSISTSTNVAFSLTLFLLDSRRKGWCLLWKH